MFFIIIYVFNKLIRYKLAKSNNNAKLDDNYFYFST